MSVPAPHFFLFSEANKEDQQGYWSFVLRAADGSATIEAADCEPQVHGQRLDLLAVVRGLEALDQPSRVTLVAPSSYVNRGIVYGLDEWGRNGWTWECFGQMVPVKNGDLWQRLDRALKIHRIERPIYRVDAAHAVPRPHRRPPQPHVRAKPARTPPRRQAAAVKPDPAARRAGTSHNALPTAVATKRPAASWAPSVRSRRRTWGYCNRGQFRWVLAGLARWLRHKSERWRLACRQLGTSLLPAPWLD
jgi:ribonuclease HI